MLDATPRGGAAAHARDPEQPGERIPAQLQFSPGGQANPVTPSWIVKSPGLDGEIIEAISPAQMPLGLFEKLSARAFPCGPGADAQMPSARAKFVRTVCGGKSGGVAQRIRVMPALSFLVDADDRCCRGAPKFHRGAAALRRS
eukprot:9493077-Pyramimonas_sp.AAC.1